MTSSEIGETRPSPRVSLWSRPWARALGYLPIYILLIAMVSGLWARPFVLTACCAVVAGLMLARWHSRSDVVFFVLCGLLGPLGEFLSVHYGAWEYTRPLLGVPLWLPLCWGIAGLYLKKTTEALTAGARG